jgi:hypothetical protein
MEQNLEDEKISGGGKIRISPYIKKIYLYIDMDVSIRDVPDIQLRFRLARYPAFFPQADSDSGRIALMNIRKYPVPAG